MGLGHPTCLAQWHAQPGRWRVRTAPASPTRTGEGAARWRPFRAWLLLCLSRCTSVHRTLRRARKRLLARPRAAASARALPTGHHAASAAFLKGACCAAAVRRVSRPHAIHATAAEPGSLRPPKRVARTGRYHHVRRRRRRAWNADKNRPFRKNTLNAPKDART